jgi:hypothetical protein
MRLDTAVPAAAAKEGVSVIACVRRRQHVMRHHADGEEGRGGAGGITVQCARVQERDDFAKDLQAHRYTQKQKGIPAML